MGRGWIDDKSIQRTSVSVYPKGPSFADFHGSFYRANPHGTNNALKLTIPTLWVYFTLMIP
ncbi:hypothetical protein RMSM_00296, partial [Rhodopirellula maiorica SM1]